MAVPVANPVMNLVNVKDSRWLTLEVCREFQRNKCTRTETECKFAHPPPHVEVQNGRVTCCFDSIKGKCQRKDPPCKYLHPPQHLKEQLLQNGRNNLILKNLQMQAMAAGTFPVMPQMVPVGSAGVATSKAVYPTVLPSQLNQLLPSPYGPGIGPAAVPNAFSQYIVPGVLPSVGGGIPAVDTPPTSISGAATVGVPQSMGAAPNSKITRPDRLEVCREFQRGTCTRQPSECRFAHPPENVTVDTTDNHVTVCMDYVKGKCNREACRYYHPPPHLQAQIKACQQRASVMAAAQAQALPPVVEVLAGAGKKRTREPADDLILQGMTVPGMVPYVKRPAVADGKSGVPMYQPGTGTTAYQQAALAAMQMQQQSFVPVTISTAPNEHVSKVVTITTKSPVITGSKVAGMIPSNAASVKYYDDTNQLLDRIPACRDFKAGVCSRPNCKYVHLVEDYVEVCDGKVTICRDAAKGMCIRPLCKYYHIPALPKGIL